MTDEKKRDFTRRLSSCNRGELIVIMYDILFEYLDEAQVALEDGDGEELRRALRAADAVLKELQESLDFNYPLSANLFPLYQYAREQLSMALIKRSREPLNETRKHMGRLYEGFVKAAEKDDSAPLMRNTESVTVGMTYGRSSLTESVEAEGNRGFLV